MMELSAYQWAFLILGIVLLLWTVAIWYFKTTTTFLSNDQHWRHLIQTLVAVGLIGFSIGCLVEHKTPSTAASTV